MNLGIGPPPARADYIETTHAIPMPAVRPGFPVSSGGSQFRVPPVMADLDEDGLSESLAVDALGLVHVFETGGARTLGWPQALGGPPADGVVVGDLDYDGLNEVVGATTSGKIVCWNFNGALKWERFLMATPVGGPVLVELDRSGTRAVGIATRDGRLHALAPDGSGPLPGWPVTTGPSAVGSAFTFVAGDNFPRVGLLSSEPDSVDLYFTYGLKDYDYSFAPGAPLGPARPVSGARRMLALPDVHSLFVVTRAQGSLFRVDPDILVGGAVVTALPALNDSVVSTPSLVDVTGDLVPEVALLGLRGDTLRVHLLDGTTGLPRPNFPRQYLGAAPGGGIVCVDLGDNAAPELIFNHSGNRVSCIRSDATVAWELTNLATTLSPAIGDMDADDGVDMAVATTSGLLYAYTLGPGGVGPKSAEWPNANGPQSRNGRHHLRDRAEFRPQWPPAVTPENVLMTRPVVTDLDGDRLPEAIWADSISGKIFSWNAAGLPTAGFPQVHNRGYVRDAPAIGDVTGDEIYEAVEGTSQGYLVWGNRNGTLGSRLIDNNRVIAPPSLADLNGDGTQDVIVGTSLGQVFAVNLVNGTNLPGFPVSTVASITLAPALGDVNGDGQTDIVVVSGPRTITAYPRTGGSPLTGWPRVFASGTTLTQPILLPVPGQTGLRVAFGQASLDSVRVHLVGANGAPLAGWPRKLTGSVIYGPVAGDFSFDGVADIVYSTSQDSVYVFNHLGNRHLARRYASLGNVEVSGLVDLDLDERPEIIAMSDNSTILGIKFNGTPTRSFDRLLVTMEPGQPPAFGDMGQDGTIDMAVTDLGLPILYTFGFGSWNSLASPWPMKGHDGFRTNALSGPTVVDVGPGPDPGPPVTGVGIAQAVPNPARGAVRFAHTRPITGLYEAEIFDLRGRRVRRVASGNAGTPGSSATWTWDGRDEGGSPVAPGRYFYQVRDERGVMREKVVRLQ